MYSSCSFTSLDMGSGLKSAANPLKLKNGGPGGIATEWVELHPSRKRLYAVTSFWNTAEAQVVT